MALSSRSVILISVLAIILFASHAQAFGAGNIASISAVEGRNWRHGDIEDLLKQISCIKHHKWNSMMIKRVYFGNWLRDYSQAMDTAALAKAPGETIRVLVWLLSFLGFGYATAEFEVTRERLGVYRPEEHIDNPKNYNDDKDARPFDERLRAPTRPIELEIDPATGMKNYIANGHGDWATSAAFVKYSFERSIHFGRLYTSGGGTFSKGKDEDLAEACRLLGQGLHTLEDFGAHTNYIELVLIELGFRNVFPLVGVNTGITLRGKHVFPLVTGTFGTVDFYHSVLGEATDHFTQSEVNEMDNALGTAQAAASSSNPLMTLVKLLSKVPGTRDLCEEATRLQASSQAFAQRSTSGGWDNTSRAANDYNSTGSFNSGLPGAGHQGSTSNDWNAPQQQYHQPPQQQDGWNTYGQPHAQSWDQGPPPQQPQWNQPQNPQSFNVEHHDPYSQPQWQQQTHQQGPGQNVYPQQTPAAPQSQTLPTGTRPSGIEGMPNFDPAKTIQQIYPILAFRDKVVRTISSIIEKIPGLEALVDRIVETLTVFILSLLAPFVRPLIEGLSKTLQSSSESLASSNGQHQFEVWTDANSSDPTHSMLSKDHFSNVLNEPAGQVAGEILKFIAPRVLYAWEHPEVPVERVMSDVEGIFHHPAIRDERNECHRNMFKAVQDWLHSRSDQGRGLEAMLNAEAVRAGRNHKAGVNDHAGHGSSMGPHAAPNTGSGGYGGGQQGGIGGYLSQAGNFVGGFTGGQQHGGNQQQHSGGFSSYISQAENMLGSHSSGGGGYGSSQQHSSSSGGGLGDMLSMASKLPIPGMQKYTSQLNKFSGFMGGSSRGIDDDNGNNNSRSMEGSRSLPVDDGDYGDANQYRNISVPGAGQVGGGGELHDAARHASDTERGPSPMPMAPPSGYEQYTSASSGQGYEPQQPEHQGYQQQGYQGYQSGGGSGYDYGYSGAGSSGRGGDPYYRG